MTKLMAAPSYEWTPFNSINSDFIKETSLYKYQRKNPTVDILNEALLRASNNDFGQIPEVKKIARGYKTIISADRLDIVTDLVGGSDDMAICLASIDLDRIDILEMVIDDKFDINQVISDTQNWDNLTLLSHAIEKDKLDVVKYLMGRGSDPILHDCMAFEKLFHQNFCGINKNNVNMEIFDYFFQMENLTHFHVMLETSIVCNHIDCARRILETGTDFKLSNIADNYSQIIGIYCKPDTAL